ncbi:MAG: aspartate aminotransferase family protein [Myxococcales bacterium]|nr:aspartate aminotransferase family protein [Myxococcales bacterium]
MADSLTDIIKGLYPYAERYGVLRRLPEQGLSRDTILSQIREMARSEDAAWEGGRCSGTMYAGDHEHYDFLNSVCAHFSHANALQRDMCPSATRFESEILAMALDLMHGEAVREHDRRHKACGAIGFGGTESIINALLVYRDKARAERGIERGHVILPDTAHPAFHKGAHLLGLDVTVAPTDPETTQVDVEAVRAAIGERTVALVGSAGNYPYGTIDPIDKLSELAHEHGLGLHVDGCLGGFILCWGEALGRPTPVFDFRLRGVTSISADTHKYGYGLKGTSVLMFRDVGYRRYQYFVAPEWKGGAYASYGLPGSRSTGLIAATWAAMVSIGREGYLAHAREIFATADRMKATIEAQPELKLMGDPSFCLSFRSDAFDIYHLNDFMKQRGWRLNGQQSPAAVHMCVTRPQTQAGVAEAWAADLPEAVAYAQEQQAAGAKPRSSAIYGGGASGLDVSSPEAVRQLMTMALDVLQDYPF